ncbi:MAG: acyl-CoA dehydrogenase, partial [bacterium]|nr:acyl-CoA dehydrogenase [bacterium]
MAIEALTPGGGFLLGESDPQDIHTPEDFTDEHHLLVNTIRNFVTQEVLPHAAAIEAKDPGLMPELLK